MGAVLEKLFIDPSTFETWPFPKIIFLLAVYGFILFKASNMISDGSELLLLFPSLAGIVGSVVLPVLGAIPDGMIVLFSGLGPKEEAQEQLSVGVGALAGSTIMLLTFPWILTLIAGRVTLDKNGIGQYNKKQKLTPPNYFHLWNTGTNVKKSIKINALIMIGTSISYLLIQGPAFFIGCSRQDESCDPSGEKSWAIAGFCTCVLLFIGYLIYQIITSNNESKKDKIEQVKRDAIDKSLISISAAFAEDLFGKLKKGTERTALLQENSEAAKHFDALLHAFFSKHDVDNNGVIDSVELRTVLDELGEHPTHDQFVKIMNEMDSNKDGVIQFNEFKIAMLEYVRHQAQRDLTPEKETTTANPKSEDIETGKKSESTSQPSQTTSINVSVATELKPAGTGTSSNAVPPVPVTTSEEEENEEEEEEIPEDLKDLSPKQQRLRVGWRAIWMLTVGVLLVVIFSDPMVDVLSALGKEIHVGSFYIAFILAPLASNASEIIASFNYAKKKTVRAATISVESLLGAATMNNTFCLAVFLTLVWARSLSWEFSAETIAILFSELCILSIAMFKTQRLAFGIVCVLLYPFALLLVFVLEKLGYN